MNVKKIEIVPKSQRAKNRIHEHGKVMKLLNKKEDKFLVESLEKTWNGVFWMGWFQFEEAEYKLLE